MVLGRGLLWKARLHARVKRCWNFRVGGVTQPSIDGSEESLFAGEQLAANGAGAEVATQRGWQGRAGRGGVDQDLLVFFTEHRNFSASFFLALNSRDLTVPTGTPSITATSSSE